VGTPVLVIKFWYGAVKLIKLSYTVGLLAFDDDGNGIDALLHNLFLVPLSSWTTGRFELGNMKGGRNAISRWQS